MQHCCWVCTAEKVHVWVGAQNIPIDLLKDLCILVAGTFNMNISLNRWETKTTPKGRLAYTYNDDVGYAMMNDDD